MRHQADRIAGRVHSGEGEEATGHVPAVDHGVVHDQPEGCRLSLESRLESRRAVGDVGCVRGRAIEELGQLGVDKDAAVRDQWEIVKDWSEQSRYEIGKTEKDATDLYDGIEKGVLPWIKARW